MKDKECNGPEVVLTPGSKYRLKSLESRDSPLITHGEFVGYTAFLVKVVERCSVTAMPRKNKIRGTTGSQRKKWEQ